MIDYYKAHKKLRASLPGRLLLTALSGVYGLAVWLRGLSYKLGLFKKRRLPIPTICFGNLTTGGTGKTSAVLLAAEEFLKEKFRPAILSRGYRRPKNEPDVVVLAHGSTASWESTGDEPWMLRHALLEHDVPVFVSPDRYKSGMLAAEHYRAHVALLDDGFQHHKLERDRDIVLLDAADPFAGGLLPLGLSREPRSALRRAALILLTHVDRVGKAELQGLREELERIAPGVPVAEASHKPKHLLSARSGERLPLSRLDGMEVVAFSGIGDPAGFEELLSRQGAKLFQAWRYPDHHRYSRQEILSLQALRQGRPLVTTLKDLPRLPEGWSEDLPGELWVLSVGLRIVRGREQWRKALFGTP